MRASRSNEIRQVWDTKLENLWIGHTAKVADEFYYTATPSDYAVASGKSESQSVDPFGIGFTVQTTDARSDIRQNCPASVPKGEAVTLLNYGKLELFAG